MIALAEVTDRFRRELLSFVSRTESRSGDEAYKGLLKRAKTTLEEYARNPLSERLISRSRKIVIDLEALAHEEMSERMRGRSITNVVSISALTRRTHYAAYVAGKWSTVDDLAGAFKAWMHNGAAHGAVSLSETIHSFVRADDPDRVGVTDVLSAFAEGAVYDARRFISLADSFYTPCAVSRYNEAKIDILSRDPTLLQLGLSMLKEIQPPAPDCHPAEIVWHMDNYESFMSDVLLRKKVETEHPDDLQRIEQTLKQNSDVSSSLQSQRGEWAMWENQSDTTKARLVGALTGITLVAVCTLLGSEYMDELRDLVSSHSDVLSTQLASLGTGGMREAGMGEFLQTFGTGGL